MNLKTRRFNTILLSTCVTIAFNSAGSAQSVRLELAKPGGALELQWHPSEGQTNSGSKYDFEIQQSRDLRSWQRIALRSSAGASNEVLRYPLNAALTRAYYRLQAHPAVRLAQATATGGAEVFGYADEFARQLKGVGLISTEEFAALHPQPTYFPGIAWDPATALFWDELNTAPEDKDRIIIDEFGQLFRHDFRLDAREQAVLKQQGFVVSEHLGTANFAETFYRVWEEDLPVFVSTDSILQAWHRSYDAMLEELEATCLFSLVEGMIDGMRAELPGARQRFGNGVLKDSLLDADYFLTVARSLLAGKAQPSPLGQDARVTATLNAIKAEQLVDCFDLFGAPRTVDFSQFKVRGHYEGSERLGRYFQTVMWLGRTDLRVAGGEFEDCLGVRHKPYERELGTAIILQYLLNNSGQFNAWSRLDQVIQAFVGWTDSMNFAQLSSLLAVANIKTPEDIKDLTTLQQFQDALDAGQIGFQNIRGDYYVSPLGGQVRLPRSFTVMGQKFVVDSWALAKTVFDQVLWDNDGVLTNADKVPRRIPSALDVAFGILGNDQVMPELTARLRTKTGRAFRDGLPYQHNLEALRRVVESQSPSAWAENIYTGWLDVLRSLSEPTTNPRFPEAMRTRAWALKTLNTQLASWTHLRHDTILYAKQSYTAGDGCSYPDGFIEPRPEFYARLGQLARRAAELISRLPVFETVTINEIGGGTKDVDLAQIKSHQVEFMEYFAGTVLWLQQMAEKELQGERLNAADVRFLDRLIQATRINGAGGPRAYDGWYTRLFYHSSLYPDSAFHLSSGSQMWDAVVADVHTDVPCDPCGDPGSVLHEGVGNVHLLVLAVDHGTGKMIYVGPVLSHYEFELIGPPKRLSDSDWKDRWNSANFYDYTPFNLDDEPEHDWSQIPPHPEWTRTWLVPHPSRP